MLTSSGYRVTGLLLDGSPAQVDPPRHQARQAGKLL